MSDGLLVRLSAILWGHGIGVGVYHSDPLEDPSAPVDDHHVDDPARLLEELRALFTSGAIDVELLTACLEEIRWWKWHRPLGHETTSRNLARAIAQEYERTDSLSPRVRAEGRA